jgi:hypothetical protein
MGHQQRWKKEGMRLGSLKGVTPKVQFLRPKQAALRQQQMKQLAQSQPVLNQRVLNQPVLKLKLKQRTWKPRPQRALDEHRDEDGHAEDFCGQKPVLEGQRLTEQQSSRISSWTKVKSVGRVQGKKN